MSMVEGGFFKGCFFVISTVFSWKCGCDSGATAERQRSYSRSYRGAIAGAIAGATAGATVGATAAERQQRSDSGVTAEQQCSDSSGSNTMMIQVDKKQQQNLIFLAFRFLTGTMSCLCLELMSCFNIGFILFFIFCMKYYQYCNHMKNILVPTVH